MYVFVCKNGAFWGQKTYYAGTNCRRGGQNKCRKYKDLRLICGSGNWTRTSDIRINSNSSSVKKIGCNTQKSGIFIVYCCVKMESSMQICTFLDWSKIAFNSIKKSTLYTFSRNDIV